MSDIAGRVTKIVVEHLGVEESKVVESRPVSRTVGPGSYWDWCCHSSHSVVAGFRIAISDFGRHGREGLEFWTVASSSVAVIASGIGCGDYARYEWSQVLTRRKLT